MAIDQRQILIYAQNALYVGIAPEWFGKVASDAKDLDLGWGKLLSKHGATEIEKFGQDGDTITIFRVSTGYYVELFDVNETTAHVFISTVPDYLRFRIDWIKPLVELMCLSDDRDADRTSPAVR